MTWESVIGLEVHVQLATESKIFSGCPAGFGQQPNSNIDSVSTGQPGVLPVLNEKAVELAVKAGIALNCTINPVSIFARKHYFYPDLPKAYQISQYDKPYAEHGKLQIETESGKKVVGITRIHMEEDAGKSTHGDAGDPNSYVDFNRAGSPLIEIVSEPDLRTPEEAGAYMRALHAIVRAIEVSDADMEKGNFRCDANVSVRRTGESLLGTRTELKNINSFKFVEKAVEYEIQRQISIIEGGGDIVQETRLWDTSKNKTVSMRGKEEAHDYRYFPDPDLPPLVIEQNLIDKIASNLPELPEERRARFVNDYQIQNDDASTLVADRDLAELFESITKAGSPPKLTANWLINEMLAIHEGPIAELTLPPEHIAQLLQLVEKQTINRKIAKNVFQQMLQTGKAPASIVEEEGLAQVSDDSELEKMIDDLIASNPDEAERLRGGENKLIGFFMGQLMKATQGKANPGIARKILLQKLNS